MSENTLPEREELTSALLYELHRFIFASTDTIGRFTASMNMNDKDGEAVLHIWRAELTGSPLSPTELAGILHVSKPAVTYLTERLLEAGYITRQPDPADRRRTVLRISELGGQVGHNFSAPMDHGLGLLFRDRSDEELATFTSMLHQLVDALSTSHPESATDDH